MNRSCPGCGATFTPVPAFRGFCRPVCQARHRMKGQHALPLLDLTSEWPEAGSRRRGYAREISTEVASGNRRSGKRAERQRMSFFGA